MPPSTPPRRLLTRRTTLLGGCGASGAFLLTGCTGGGEQRPRLRRGSAREADPDVAVATEALLAVETANTLARETAERHPGLAEPLSSLLGAHAEHVAVLDDAVPREATATPSPSPPVGTGAPGDAVSEQPPTGTTGGPSVPRDERRALALVVSQERALTVQLKQLAFRARSGPFARLLAGVAASAAQHAAVLDTSAQDGAA